MAEVVEVTLLSWSPCGAARAAEIKRAEKTVVNCISSEECVCVWLEKGNLKIYYFLLFFSHQFIVSFYRVAARDVASNKLIRVPRRPLLSYRHLTSLYESGF